MIGRSPEGGRGKFQPKSDAANDGESRPTTVNRQNLWGEIGILNFGGFLAQRNDEGGIHPVSRAL